MKITRFITGLTAAVMLTSAAAFPELPAPTLIKDLVIAAQAAELTEKDISTELYAMTKDGEKVLIGSGSGSHYSIKNIRLGYYDIAGYDFTGFQLEASLPELPAGSVGKIDIGGSYTISYWKEDMSDTAAVFARDGVEIKSSTKKATVKLSIDELYIDSLDFSVDYKNLRFEKEQQSISGATVKVSDKVYTGKALTPEVSVTLDGKKLSSGKDYTVKYSNNTEPGSGRVVVAGTGDYKGSVTKTFAISPKQTTIKSAKSAK
ncbi:MAG: hypothetical protein IJ723_01575, partial [Ruminococcus sp.]|nr:hypothetical protein [Ruminococcus sp.]